MRPAEANSKVQGSFKHLHTAGYRSIKRQVLGHLREQLVLPAFLLKNRLPELRRIAFEYQYQGGGMSEPGLALHLFFELAGTPAGVPGKHPYFPGSRK